MILITGGGTGGHLAIARALGEELKKRGKQAIYVGSLNGQDRLWFDNQKTDQISSSSIEPSTAPTSNPFSHCYFLATSGVVNKTGITKLRAIFAQLKALAQVRTIFKLHKVCAVISVGGFSAGPASIGAIIFKKPLFIHEQNAIPGKLNTLLAPFSKRTFNAFMPPFTPYPIKQEALEQQRIRTSLKTLIFIGGSQGARAINDLALSVAPSLLKRGITIIHQCGASDYERVCRAYENLGIKESITLFGFAHNLISYLAKADICVGRAGASSVWENAALALPTLYIPYPYAAKNHQAYNANYFVSRGLGAMLLEQNLDEENNAFFTSLDTLAEKLELTSRALCAEIKSNGAQVIIDEILEFLA